MNDDDDDDDDGDGDSEWWYVMNVDEHKFLSAQALDWTAAYTIVSYILIW